MDNNYLLKIQDLSHDFPLETGDKFHVINHLSFDVKKGEYVSVIGPSGCGKSTLIKIVAGLIKPTSGMIEMNAEKISMIFQHFAIFPWLNVFNNVSFGLKMADYPRAKKIKITRDMLKEVGLFESRMKYPKELSGGMLQRVGIARALSMNPDFLLMDEPFSSLDNFTAEKLREEILYLWQKHNLSILMVTHLIEEAIEVSDKVVVLSDRPANVKKIIEITLKRPRNKRSPEFFKLVDEIAELIEHK